MTIQGATNSAPFHPDPAAPGAISVAERVLVAAGALSVSPDPATRLRHVAAALLGLVGAERVIIATGNVFNDRFDMVVEQTSDDWPASGDGPCDLPTSAGDPALTGPARSITTADLPPSPARTCRERAGIGASLLAPLPTGGRPPGLLALHRRSAAPFTAADLATADVVAREVARIVVAGAQVDDLALQHRVSHVAIAAMQQAAGQADQRAVLRRIVRDVRDLLGAECLQIELWYPTEGRVEVVAEAVDPDWADPLPGIVGYDLDTWPSIRPLLEGRDHVLITPDLVASERERAHLRIRDLHASLIVAMRAGGDIVGAIIAQTRRTPVALTAMLPALSDVAAIASIAARPARSPADRSARERQHELVRHLSAKIATESNLEHLLDDATYGVLDAARAAVCVAVVNGPQDEPLGQRIALEPHHEATSLAGLDPRSWPVTTTHDDSRRIVAFDVTASTVGPTDARALLSADVTRGLIAPLTNDGNPWGDIALLFSRRHPPGENTAAFVGEVAQLVASGASEAYLLHDSARKTADLEILLEISRAAVSGSDVDIVLENITALAIRSERIDSCAFDLIDPVTQDFRRLAFAYAPDLDLGGLPPGPSPFISSRAASESLATFRPVSLLSTDPDLTPAEHARFEELGLGSVIIVPLHIGMLSYGLALIGSRSTAPFLDRHLRFVEEIAAQASQAIDRSRLIAALTARADLDGLTGLLNHRAIQERLDDRLAQATLEKRTLSILMVDLDGFKLFNDTYGHLVGDRYLREAAAHIAAAVGRAGIIGRYGGDEFLAILPDGGLDEAAALARAILERIRNAAFEIGETRLPIQLSIGAATYPLQGRSRRALIERADSSMYAAKDAGGGRVVQFDAAPFGGGSDAFSVLTGLVQAVDRKDRYTRIHSDRVTALAVVCGRELGLGDDDLAALFIAGQLHDVGKIAVPDNLLRRPGSISSEQLEIMHQHVTFSEMMIRDVPHDDLVLPAVAHHHERWDGHGYPRGLAGDKISLLGRILAIADSVAAMTQDRPYIKARPWVYAIGELRANAGTQFDPTLAPRIADLLEALGEEAATMPPPPAVLTAGSSGDPG
jgi:diguanylate cyclase (GGDEF)-like protein